MAGQPIQDVSVNIGAKTASLEGAMRTLRTASAETQAAIEKTAAASVKATRVQESASRAIAATKAREADIVSRAEVAASRAADRAEAAARRRDATIAREIALIDRKRAVIEASGNAQGKAALDAAAVIERAMTRIDAAEGRASAARQRATDAAVRLDAVRIASGERVVLAAERQQARYQRTLDREAARLAAGQGGGAGAAGGRGARGAQIQNAAFQVGDVFTQISAGTDPMRAIAIQLPQLLGGFGMVGAVVGAAAAAIAPFALRLFETKDAAAAAQERAEALADTVEGLTDAVGRSVAANADARRSLVELTQQYGTAAGAIAALDEQQAAIERRRAQLAVDSARGAIAGQFGDVGRMIELLDKLDYQSAGGVLGKRFSVDFGPALEQLEALSSQFGIGEEAARGLYDRILDLQAASGPAEQADAFRAMADYIVQSAGGTEQLTAAQAELVARLYEASEQAAILAANAGDVSFDGAVASAEALTAELRTAFGALQSLRAAQIETAARLRVEAATVGRPVERAGQLAGLEYDAGAKRIADATYVDPILAVGLGRGRAEAVGAAEENERLRQQIADREAALRESQRPARTGGGGGGGGRARRASGGGGGRARVSDEDRAAQREYNSLLREAGTIYDRTRTDAEKYADELANIQRLQAAGVLGLTDEQRDRIAGMDAAERASLLAETSAKNAETARRAIADLSESYADLGDVGRTVEDGLRETFGAIVTGASSAREAVGQLAERLASTFADRAFDGIWDALAGGLGGGSGGGLFGGILKAIGIPGFASGTDWAPAGVALVGERGPELVRLNAGSQVLSAERTRAMLGGGGGAMRVHLEIDSTPDFEARIVRQSEGIAVATTRRGLAEYSRGVAPARNAQIAANPRRRS